MIDASFGLADVLERIGGVDPYLAAGIGRGEHAGPWWTPAGLASDDGSLDRLATGYGESWGVAGDRCSQASYVVLDLSWYAFAPLVASLLAAGTMPRLDGASVALDPSTRVGRLALDPLAPRTPATVADLRDEVVTWMTPVVEAIVARRWLGRKPAWWGVGDRVVAAFEYIGGLLAEEERSRELGSALVHEPGSPLDSPRHRFATIEYRGVARTIGLRAACCRFYRIPGQEKCTTCPLLSDEDRQRRIRVEIETTLGATAPADEPL